MSVKNFLTTRSAEKQKQLPKNNNFQTGVQRKNLADGVRNPYSRYTADTHTKILRFGIGGTFLHRSYGCGVNGTVYINKIPLISIR